MDCKSLKNSPDCRKSRAKIVKNGHKICHTRLHKKNPVCNKAAKCKS